MIHLLLAAALTSGECLEDTVDIVRMEQHTIAKVDLTGDRKRELLSFYLSFIDSSYCTVHSIGDSLTKLFEDKFFVERGDWRLYLGDYNNDCVYDFTVSPPNMDVVYYVTWNKDGKKFDVVVDTSYVLPNGK